MPSDTNEIKKEIQDRHASFKKAAEPMVKWLQENGNPHSLVTIEQDGAMFYSGEIGQPFEVQD